MPIAYSICWGRASGKGAMSGATSGLVLGVAVWLTYGRLINVGPNVPLIDRLKMDEVMLAGNVVSIVSSAIICTIVSLLDPDDCDWSTTKAIPLIEDDPNAHVAWEEEEELEQALKKIGFFGLLITILLLIVWPALALPVGTFSQGYFGLWVYVSIIWGIASCAVMIFLPLWESRHAIMCILTCGAFRPSAKEIDLDGDEEQIDDDFIVEDR